MGKTFWKVRQLVKGGFCFHGKRGFQGFTNSMEGCSRKVLSKGIFNLYLNGMGATLMFTQGD